MDNGAEVIRVFLPEVGSVWEWEPLKPHARETVTVTELIWSSNGTEWWIKTEDSFGRQALNDFSRWIEAAVFVKPNEERK